MCSVDVKYEFLKGRKADALDPSCLSCISSLLTGALSRRREKLKSAVQAEPKERCWLILCLWSSLDALDG